MEKIIRRDIKRSRSRKTINILYMSLMRNCQYIYIYIYTSLTKSYEHFVTSTRMFSNIFKFLLTSALSYIHCCNFFYFYCIMLYSVCLLSEKKRRSSRVLIHDCIFFPNLHISKKFHVPAIFPMTS